MRWNCRGGDVHAGRLPHMRCNVHRASVSRTAMSRHPHDPEHCCGALLAIPSSSVLATPRHWLLFHICDFIGSMPAPHVALAWRWMNPTLLCPCAVVIAPLRPDLQRAAPALAAAPPAHQYLPIHNLFAHRFIDALGCTWLVHVSITFWFIKQARAVSSHSTPLSMIQHAASEQQLQPA